jgi:gas vesicle protein
MINQQRKSNEAEDPWSESRSHGGSAGPGSLLMATLLGFGVGLLVAPQPGSKTRKLLRKRLAALGEGVEEGLGEVQEVSSKARKRAKERLARLREEAGEEFEGVGERWERAKGRLRDLEFGEREESSPFSTILAVAAGLAATYFLTSERTASARSRVQHVAVDARRRATDQWDRFQRGGIRGRRQRSEANESRSETRSGSMPSDEAPQAS